MEKSRDWLCAIVCIMSNAPFAFTRLATTHVTNLSVGVNSSVTLRCEMDTYQPIRWAFTPSSSNQPQVMIYTGIPGQWREGFQQRFVESFNSTTGVSQLTINQVQLSDAGEYRCLETNSSTHVIRFHLNVSDYGPMTTDDTTFRVVNVSESVTFRCTTNIMEPIRWFYTGSSTNQSIPKTPLIIYNGRTVRKELASRFNVNSSTGDSQLSIRSVEPGDNGTYSCKLSTTSSQQIDFVLVVTDSNIMSTGVKDKSTETSPTSTSREDLSTGLDPSMYVAVGCLMMTVLVALYVIALLWKGGRLRYLMFDKHPGMMSLPSTGANTLHGSTSLDIVAMYAEVMKGSVRSDLLRPSTDSCTQFVYAQVLPRTQRPVSVTAMETGSDNASAASFQPEAVRASRTFSALNINTAQDYYPPPVYAETNPRPH